MRGRKVGSWDWGASGASGRSTVAKAKRCMAAMARSASWARDEKVRALAAVVSLRP